MSNTNHLSGLSSSFLEMADAILFWDTNKMDPSNKNTHRNKNAFLVHSQILSAKSNFFVELIAINRAASTPTPEGTLPAIKISNVPVDIQNSPHRSRFLRHLYTDSPNFESIEEAEGVLLLADFFGTPFESIETYLCRAAIGALTVQQAADIDLLCQLLETSTAHRLTQLAALVLPWAVQRLSVGPQLDPVFPVWKEAQERLDRISAALDSTLKLAAIDAQWWAAGIPCRCTTCGCASTELALVMHPAYLARSMSLNCIVNGSPVRTPLPHPYLSAARHLAHVLEEKSYGRTTEQHGFTRSGI